MECPYKPELLINKPIGQHHCPVCGMMVMAGSKHPLLVYFRDADDVSLMDAEMGTSMKSGWFYTNALFDEGGPFSTYEEACAEYLEDSNELMGK